MTTEPLRIGFLASGRGSSARAIVGAIKAGDLAAEARLLVSNKRDSAALAFAESAAIPNRFIPTLKSPDQADADLADAMAAHGVNLIVLSGYMRRIGPKTLSRYAGRIINIHPGPLPQFGGEGMYGRRVHDAVVAAGSAESAIVIHVVDGEYDHGPELARKAVPVQPGETAQDLEARVTSQEPAFFVEIVKRIAVGDLTLP